MILENRLGHVNRGKEIGYETNNQDNSKAANGAGPETAQESRGNHGGHVGVNNRPKSIVKASIHGGKRGFAVAQFFADALKDQNVGVHAHADDQDDTNDAQQDQYRAEKGHYRQKDDQVEDQGED